MRQNLDLEMGFRDKLNLIDLSQNKVKMQYIFENFRYFYCFG